MINLGYLQKKTCSYSSLGCSLTFKFEIEDGHVIENSPSMKKYLQRIKKVMHKIRKVFLPIVHALLGQFPNSISDHNATVNTCATSVELYPAPPEI